MQKGILALLVIFLLPLVMACSSADAPASEQPALTSPPEGAVESASEAIPPADPTTPAASGQEPGSPAEPETAAGDSAEVQDLPEDAETALAQSEEAFPVQASGQGAPAAGVPDSTDSPQGGQPMVDVQPGQEYQAGTMVNFPAVGIAFQIPQSWIGGLPQGSAAFLMRSNSQPGLVVVMSHQATTNNELLSHLNQPLPLDNDLVLNVTGQPQVEEPWIKAGVTTSDGMATYEGYLMALVRQQGQGIAIVAIGPLEQAEYYRQLVEEIAGSVQESAVSSAAEQQASGDNSALVQEWDQYLRGKRMTYLHSYSSGSSGGYSTHYELDLCSDGSFVYYDRSHVSVDTGGAFGFSGGTTSNTGQWRITSQGGQIVAELRWQDGETGYNLLEYADNKTYVDGQRWFVTSDNASCP